MNRTALAATAAAVLLLLTGCTSTTTAETITVTPGASGTYSDGDTSVEVEPLTAETPTVAADGEAAFLGDVRAKLRPDNVIPNATDEQLVDAGESACEAIANGENTITLSLIDGEQADASGFFPDSAVIISAARSTICSD